MDAVVTADWAERWRAQVAARQAEAEAAGAGQRGYWDRRAAAFKASLEGRPEDPFLDFLEPWLAPHKTVLDVGAGWGRHALPLAARVDWVTAVEPAEGMRELLEPAPNLTVIASPWEDAEPAYRYGWELHNRPAYRGRTWSEIEDQARRDWAVQHAETPWDRVRDNVREAWEHATD